MKIKRTFLNKVFGSIGNLEIEPDEGFEIRTFTDFESKLLVVDESPMNPKPLVPYLPKQYIVNPKNGKILSFEDYKHYFNYEPQEIFSVDRELKLTVQRKHNFETGRDFKYSKLIHIKTGRVLSEGKSVAFYNEWRKNSMEDYYEDQQRRKEAIAIEDAKQTLKEHFQDCLSQIKEGSVLIEYENIETKEIARRRLSYGSDEQFKLIHKKGKFYLKRKVPNVDYFASFKTFNSVNDFWKYLIADKNWYCNYRPSSPPKESFIFSSLIIETINEIKKANSCPTKDYEKLGSWERVGYTDKIKRRTYKNFCPQCQREMGYSSRYPKAICGRCRIQLTDKNGRKVVFFNKYALGYGCIGYYSNTLNSDKIEYPSNVAYINEDEFVAQEARFGGIVIQKKDKVTRKE